MIENVTFQSQIYCGRKIIAGKTSKNQYYRSSQNKQ
jgi:hypothetical protein